MRYEEFKQRMIEKITFAVPCETTVSVRSVRKNNGIELDGISIRKGDAAVAPTFYLSSYYQRYLRGAGIEELAEEILAKQEAVRKTNVDPFGIISEEIIREQVHFKVVHYDMNAVLLKELPHRKYLDLAMVFYIRVNPKILPDAHIMIRNEHLAEFSIKESDLIQWAVKNTVRDLPTMITEMNDYVMPLSGMVGEAAEEDERKLYILTNKEYYFGAACLFYPDTEQLLKERFDTDLILIPSSVHEWLIMPLEGNQIEEIDELIKEVNSVAVEPDEVLSTHAYVFARESGEFGYPG